MWPLRRVRRFRQDVYEWVCRGGIVPASFGFPLPLPDGLYPMRYLALITAGEMCGRYTCEHRYDVHENGGRCGLCWCPRFVGGFTEEELPDVG